MKKTKKQEFELRKKQILRDLEATKTKHQFKEVINFYFRCSDFWKEQK